STELLARFPAGFKLRGWLDLTDKNRFLVALYNPVKGISEIGFVDRDRKEYVKYVNDEPWTQKLNFGIQNRIYFSFYTKGLCEETHVQFSANHIYYVLNIDESFCSVQYSDMLLFDCNCAVALKHQILKKAGTNLRAAAYWTILRLTDEDENYTNWFWLSQQSNLGSKNNAIGEYTKDALRIQIPAMKVRRYNYIQIAVIRLINGAYEVKLLPKIYYNQQKLVYDLVSENQFLDFNITLDDIFQRQIGYIRGDGITSKDGRSILFNTYNNPNYDIQAVADRVRVRWVAYLAPLSEAHRYKTMPRNEVVPLGLRRNWCDGNSSVVGHLKGRKATEYDLEMIPAKDNKNCSLCDEPRWKVENTATVTKWYCGDPFKKSEESAVKSNF